MVVKYNKKVLSFMWSLVKQLATFCLRIRTASLHQLVEPDLQRTMLCTCDCLVFYSCDWRTELLCLSLQSGSGRVFSGSRIWPKNSAGFGKTQNILTGFGNWLHPGKRDWKEFGHGTREFLPDCWEFGKFSPPRWTQWPESESNRRVLTGKSLLLKNKNKQLSSVTS